MRRMLQAITTEHQAASWVVSAESSFTSRKDMDVDIHHRRTGIEHSIMLIFLFSLHFWPISYPPHEQLQLIRGTGDG